MAPTVRVPSDENVSVVDTPPLLVTTTLPAPAVAVRAPTVSVVVWPENPVNSSVPPAEPTVVSAPKVTPAVSARTAELPPVAASASLPWATVAAPVKVLVPESTHVPGPVFWSERLESVPEIRFPAVLVPPRTSVFVVVALDVIVPITTG